MSSSYERSLLDEIDRLKARITELQDIGSKLALERQARDRFGGRKRRQSVVLNWAKRVLGDEAASVKERALRILEEAIEVAQAAGVGEDTTNRMVARVFYRQTGNLQAEVGGLLVTALAMCEAIGVDGDELERDEMERILSLSEDFVREKHQAKVRQGLAL